MNFVYSKAIENGKELHTDVQVTISKTEIENEKIIQYGIDIITVQGNIICGFASIPAISTKQEYVNNLAKILLVGNVSCITAADIIEEYVAYHV